eukprot:254630-Pyramimonas_sp.AAC.1
MAMCSRPHCCDGGCLDVLERPAAFPNGVHIRFSDLAFPHTLWRTLMEVCGDMSWSGAAKYYEGSGLEGGVDFTAPRAFLRNLEKYGSFEAA